MVITSAIRDISERKKAEEEIRQLNTNLEARVMERTEELLRSNEELLQFFVGAQQLLGALHDARFQVGVELANFLLRLFALADVADGAGDHHPLLGLQRAETDLDRKLRPVLAH